MGTGQPDRSILLVGMMGSGKSAVGRALADRLDRKAILVTADLGRVAVVAVRGDVGGGKEK